MSHEVAMSYLGGNMKDYPSRSMDQYQLRLPDGWRAAIKEEARKAHRSMNAEIVAAIEKGMAVKGVSFPLPADDEKDRQGGHPDGLEQSHL